MIRHILILGLLIASFFVLSAAECDEALLPYSGICGQGQCINNTCVCHEGFSGRAEFWDTTGRNCVTHELTRLVLLCICYTLSFLGSILILYRFYVLWNARARAANGGKITSVMMISATLVGEFIALFATMSFLIYGDQRMYSSIGANVSLMLATSFGYACSASIGIFQLQMAIRSVVLKPEERALIKRIYVGTIVANVLAEALLTTTLLGNLISTDWVVELGWMRAQMAGTLISLSPESF